MSDKKEMAEAIAYIDGLNPSDPLELARIYEELKSLIQTILSSTDRINAPRRVKLWTEETNQLRTEVKQLLSSIEDAKALDQQYHNYEEQKTKLLAQKKLIEDLSGQKEEIAQLNTFVSRFNLADLQNDVENLRENAEGVIGQVKGRMEELSNFFRTMKSNAFMEIQQLLTNLGSNTEEITHLLKDADHQVSLKKIELTEAIYHYDLQLAERQNEYNALSNQLTNIIGKLKEVKDKHSKNIRNYETHFSQNQSIWGELGKKHNLDVHLDKLMESTKKNLQQFDLEIKNLLEKADHLNVF